MLCQARVLVNASLLNDDDDISFITISTNPLLLYLNNL